MKFIDNFKRFACACYALLVSIFLGLVFILLIVIER